MSDEKKYKLVIVESPSKGTTIGKYLGSDYKVIASQGHIIDLPKNEFGVDLTTFQEDLKIMEGKEDRVKEIKKLAENASEVFLASDPDREGEAIAFHLRSILPKKLKSHRVKFNAITKDKIIEAIQNPIELDENLYHSQQTRRILDRIVGYKISPVLWQKITSGLSAGRVQSVAVRIIVDREDEIINFKPEKSFQLIANLVHNKISFESKFFGKDANKKMTLKDESIVDQIVAEVLNKQFSTVSVVAKEKKIQPTPPFTTSKLQQDASNKLGFSSKQTMQVAQKLYEGKSLGESGTHGLITYMRTDSVRTEDKALKDVRDFIKNEYGEELLAKDVIIHKLKKQDAQVQDAHEAIRPTSLNFSPEKIKNYLTDDEFLLYDLIWKKFISSQMSSCLIDQTIYTFECSGNFFKTYGNVVKFLGFKQIYQEQEDDKKDKDEESEDNGKLPELVQGTLVDQEKNITKKETWTSPPPRYTEATLVGELEDKGVGRPSTYAAIISNIVDKKYVGLDQKKFKPTQIGTVLSYMLVKEFPVQFDIKFTASIEEKLDSIAEGKLDYKKALSDFWADLNQILNNVDKNVSPLKPNIFKINKQCECGGIIDVRLKGLNTYEVCGKCNKTKKVKYMNGEFMEQENKVTKSDSDKKCPSCENGFLVEKTGKFGKFLACNNYPECKYIEKSSAKVDVLCPICLANNLVEKKKKDGNPFWGCSGYPKCNGVLWNQPVKQRCVHCLHPTLEKIKDKLICTKCKKTNDPIE